MNKNLHWFIISTFVSLYLVVSVISTIHVIDFFKLSNPDWLAIFLAISFEIGAAASLASLIVLKKMNKTLVWLLFFVLTAMQGMGNTYYAFINLENFEAWSQLFGLEEEELIYQKRILSIISGAILPLISLGFIKSLVDYIKPDEAEKREEPVNQIETEGNPMNREEEINSKIVKEEIIQETIIDGGLPTAEFPKRETFEVFLTSDENTDDDENLKQLDDEIKEIGKVETVEMMNANSNRAKIIDKPSSRIDPTRL